MSLLRDGMDTTGDPLGSSSIAAGTSEHSSEPLAERISASLQEVSFNTRLNDIGLTPDKVSEIVFKLRSTEILQQLPDTVGELLFVLQKFLDE